MATLAPLKQHFHKLDGTIAAGYYLTFYAAGTTTPQNTFTDQSGGTPNTNPILLNARGEASIWYDPTLNYKVILSSDALATAVEWTMDVVASIPDISSFVTQVKGADIASAATINLDIATGDYVHITGSVGINTVTLASGRARTVVFDGNPVLTASAGLILPKGAANITAAPGDVAMFRGEGSSVTRLVSYQVKTGYASLNGSTSEAFSASTATLYNAAGNSSLTMNTTFAGSSAVLQYQQAGATKWSMGAFNIGTGDANDFALYNHTTATSPLVVNSTDNLFTYTSQILIAPPVLSATITLDAANAAATSAQITYKQGGGLKWSMGAFYIGTGDANDFALYNYTTAASSLIIDSATDNVTVRAPIITQGYTVAGLAALTPVKGMEAHVTDATAPTYLGALVGGGAVTCPVFYNGVAWVSH